MKTFLFFSFILTITACSRQEESIPEIETQDRPSALFDSAYSKIKVNQTGTFSQASIENTIYSIEYFNYQDTPTSFVTKRTVNDIFAHAQAVVNRSEHIEFFDYQLKKVFEINSAHRSIELKRDYFVTHGVFSDLPRVFELNNYENGEMFTHCWGTCLVAKIPNTKTLAHFGYQPLGFSIDTTLQILGSLTFSINHNLEQELCIWYNPPSNYNNLVNIRFESTNEIDKMSHTGEVGFRELTLWSKNELEGKEHISGFDIVLSFRREKMAGSHEYEKVEHTISIIDGKITGKNVIETDDELGLTLD